MSHGLVLGAGTGQHPYQTRQECNQLYELGAKRINGRCHLICQSSALVLDEVLERSKEAQGLGADALMILPPYLEGPEDDDGLFSFYQAIDGEVETDIIGYNIPQTTSRTAPATWLPTRSTSLPVTTCSTVAIPTPFSPSLPGLEGASGVQRTTCRTRR
jgi:dihydrodipicolinate synthase/N-acetylneuraminate lyase